ncbi:zinc finger CCCH-type with G patch domain-containing protein [Polistes fuscatus]|uniref:zinc finger CCCH-type with G patch domain-containing protein n=1 Tax=Polistes fuscatus TaxID=30207 RepID=UPI001CA91005|nr:zinc finger CCCH-type with G patch domain-containing protein [Polistes fuscatus]
MADVASLKEAIIQYEFQLSQIVSALSMETKESDKNDLLNLKSNLQELIDLTKENLEKLEGIDAENSNMTESKENDEDDENDENDPLANEYALFKAEIEDCSNNSKSVEQNSEAAGAWNDIEDELKQLEGMKCRARLNSSWDSGGYHNAMICSVDRSTNPTLKSMHEIKVRVLFINPTYKEMLPCPYFFDGNCKFSDEQCHFSHGEIVPFSNLQEYKEPNYENIKIGSRVLVKQNNNLWYRSIVIKMPDEVEEVVRVKLEAKGDIAEIGLQDLVPLDTNDSELSDESDDSEIDNNEKDYTTEALIDKSLLMTPTTQPLGHWEKHTRGMGSKLMAKMGYVRGTGLGKLADGRIEPVEALVLPPGRSLDHCMELREIAGNDKNLFSAEFKMRKKQQKLERQRQREYEREKEKEQSNIFNFLNTTLNTTLVENKNKDVASTSKSKCNLKTESNWKLNVANFQVGEDINRLERESLKLKNSMTRHSKDSTPYKNILAQYNEKQKKLIELRACEKNIAAEQTQRKNKAKLSIF